MAETSDCILSEPEKFYIRHNPQNSAEHLAKVLEKPVVQVQKYILFLEALEATKVEAENSEQGKAPVPEKTETEKPEAVVPAPETGKKAKKENIFLNSFGKRKDGGVLTMTASASELIDEHSKHSASKRKGNLPANSNDYIRPARED